MVSLFFQTLKLWATHRFGTLWVTSFQTYVSSMRRPLKKTVWSLLKLETIPANLIGVSSSGDDIIYRCCEPNIFHAVLLYFVQMQHSRFMIIIHITCKDKNFFCSIFFFLLFKMLEFPTTWRRWEFLGRRGRELSWWFQSFPSDTWLRIIKMLAV